jgi:hypothetical protein
VRPPDDVGPARARQAVGDGVEEGLRRRVEAVGDDAPRLGVAFGGEDGAHPGEAGPAAVCAFGGGGEGGDEPGAQDRAEPLGRVRDQPRLAQKVEAAGVDRAGVEVVDRLQEAELVAVVVGEARRHDSGVAGDFARGHRAVAAFGEEPLRRFADERGRVVLLRRAGHSRPPSGVGYGKVSRDCPRNSDMCPKASQRSSKEAWPER